MSSVGALYVHAPFCARKCLYCDFASEATPKDDSRIASYVGDMVEQITRLKSAGFLRECRTAYIGGGTPSFLGPRLLGGLISAVREACPELIELSFEANPDSLSNEVLEAAKDAGATRVSIGVQSFDDAELEALGRIHTARVAKERVRAATKTGLDVSVDLMCAIPHQTESSWAQTLDTVLELGVDHVSVYPLAIEEGTPFDTLYGEDDVPWNSEDVQAERMEQAERALESTGYERYEVASYALAGHACQHNQAYWTGVSYLGLGNGAASMLDAEQYVHLQHIVPELPALPTASARIRLVKSDSYECEFLSGREAWAEDLMLGMRMVQGVEVARVPPATVAKLVDKGLVEVRGDHMVPTHDGWLLGNELYGELWDLARL